MKTKETNTRTTKETSITCTVDLTSNKSSINTNIAFLDHMLTAFAYYANISLDITATGDTEIDQHHLVEDIGIVLGKTLNTLIYQEVGRKRYSTVTLPMDDALSQVSIDLSNRPYLVCNCPFHDEFIGSYQTNNTKEFFYALAIESRITLHINALYGDNDHHLIESVFKALGLALKDAMQATSEEATSTKGAL